MGFLGDLGGSIFGGKASMPSPGEAQKQSLKGTIKNWPFIEQLGNLYNQYQTQAAEYPYIQNLPGYEQNWQQMATNTGQLLQGQLPESDVRALANSVIGNRFALGQGATSPNTLAALERSVLGSELAGQQMGMQNMYGMMSAMPRGQLFNPSPWMLTPQQQQSMQYAQNQANAQPDPMLNYLNNYIMSVGGNIGGMAVGKSLLGGIGGTRSGGGGGAGGSGGGGGGGVTGGGPGAGNYTWGDSGYAPWAYTPEEYAGGVGGWDDWIYGGWDPNI